jgi:hypothetical protein
MPEKKLIKRARALKRQGKAATTQAGEFVREEFGQLREGFDKLVNKAGAKSAEIARKKPLRKSSATIIRVVKKPRRAASHRSLSKQAHAAAKARTSSRSQAAKKAARTRARH